MILDLRDVSYRYPGAARDALTGVSLALDAGDFVAVLGPNGSGKTTLVRVALGAVAPLAGQAVVGDRPAHRWAPQALARLVGVVPQREASAFPLRVRDAVLLGRYPHLSPWAPARAVDHAAVEQALRACDAVHLAERWLATLSGGEYQRVRLARALAQEPRLLVLDEPTVSLDVRHEMELFERARALAVPAGLAVLLITHHVNLAARFADRVLLLDDGRPAAHGRPAETLTRETVERVFAWPVAIERFENAPQIVPLRRRLEEA
jgi:iron complex transport system ATP-binding protein